MRAGPRERRRRRGGRVSEFARRAPDPTLGMWQRRSRPGRRGQGERWARHTTLERTALCWSPLVPPPSPPAVRDFALPGRGRAPEPPKLSAGPGDGGSEKQFPLSRCGGRAEGGDSSGGRVAAPRGWWVSGKLGAPGKREAEEPRATEVPGAAAHCALRTARSVAEEPRPGSVDAFLPRPGRLARSSPAEPERLGPIPGDYARQRTNQLRQLMNIYDLG